MVRPPSPSSASAHVDSVSLPQFARDFAFDLQQYDDAGPEATKTLRRWMNQADDLHARSHDLQTSSNRVSYILHGLLLARGGWALDEAKRRKEWSRIVHEAAQFSDESWAEDGRPLGTKKEQDMWVACMAVARHWGLQIALYYGLMPSDDASGGQKYVNELRAAVRANEDWSVAVRRLNQIRYRRFNNAPEAMAKRSAAFGNEKWLVTQQDLQKLKSWPNDYPQLLADGWVDENVSQKQATDLGCGFDTKGLLVRANDSDLAGVLFDTVESIAVDPDAPVTVTAKAGMSAVERPASKKTRPTANHDDSRSKKKQKQSHGPKISDSTSSRQRLLLTKSSTAQIQRNSGGTGDETGRATEKRSKNSQIQSSGNEKDEIAEKKSQASRTRRRGDGNGASAGKDPQTSNNQSSGNKETRQTEEKTSSDQQQIDEGRDDQDRPSSPKPPTRICNPPTPTAWKSDFERTSKQTLESLDALKSHLPPPSWWHVEHAMEWLERARQPAIRTCIDSNASRAQTAACDLYHLSSQDVMHALDAGTVFDKPVLVDEKFRDSSRMSIVSYFEVLRKRGIDSLEAQCIGTSIPQKTDLAELGERIASEQPATPSPISRPPIISSNLRAQCRADRPMFTKHRRMLALENAVFQSQSGKKSIRQKIVDIEENLNFDQLATTFSFWGPHVNILNGTWIRVLEGWQLWLVAVNLKPEDWFALEQNGQRWIPPPSKVRAIALQKDDVLLLPPGVLVVHASLTLTPHLITSGAIWDELTLPKTLSNLAWIGAHSHVGNESLPMQIGIVIANLQRNVDRDRGDYCGSAGRSEFERTFLQALAAVRDLRCRCKSDRGACNVRTCRCHQRSSRCTTLCHTNAEPFERGAECVKEKRQTPNDRDLDSIG